MDTIKVYMSYSWDEEENQPFIEKLVEQLQKYKDPNEAFQIKCVFDKKAFEAETQELDRFMVSGIKEADFVVILITPSYKEKADNGKCESGVGTETVYIRSKLRKDISRIITVLRKKEVTQSDLPEYLQPYWSSTMGFEDEWDRAFNKLIWRIHKAYYKQEESARTLNAQDFPASRIKPVDSKGKKENTLLHEVSFDFYFESKVPLETRAELTFDYSQVRLTHSELMSIFCDLMKEQIIYNHEQQSVRLCNLKITNVSKEYYKSLLSCLFHAMEIYITELYAFELKYEVTNFPFISNTGCKFNLISVEKNFWKMMIETVNKYDYGNGKTPWHIFQRHGSGIHVFSDISSTNENYDFGEHMLFEGIKSEEVINDEIVIYIDSIFYKLQNLESIKINKRECWGVEYAYKWLIDEFIPFVQQDHEYYEDCISIDHYAQDSNVILEMQQFYACRLATVTDSEIENLKTVLIYCLEKECLEKEIEYIWSKLGVRKDKYTDSREEAKGIIHYLKSQAFKTRFQANDSNSNCSLADDLLRCLYVFSWSSHHYSLAIQTISLAQETYLKSLVEKMKRVTLIEKYKMFKI
ncbi:MAG: toll/interleukin-1 receptor domain-containing protein [Oscillospiraceae bacterium]|jgi:hypothetical protein|nr:toll/interleukin-1 receptor domain-containing protein [Oscillospiraceae bacterium]